MKNPAEFKKALRTLLHSWGSDTPPEVIWGLNDMIAWLELEYNVTIDNRFDEPYDENAIDPNVVIAELESKL